MATLNRLHFEDDSATLTVKLGFSGLPPSPPVIFKACYGVDQFPCGCRSSWLLIRLIFRVSRYMAAGNSRPFCWSNARILALGVCTTPYVRTCGNTDPNGYHTYH